MVLIPCTTHEIDVEPLRQDVVMAQPAPSSFATPNKKRKLEVILPGVGLTPNNKMICMNIFSYEDTQCDQLAEISEYAHK